MPSLPPDSPDWLQRGLPHLWMPYAQMKTAPVPLPIVSAEGCTLTLADGRKLIDGIASWWSVCHGYQHPYLVEAMERQLRQLSHVMFGGLAHEQACVLAERLAAMTLGGDARVFFSDSGSTAVEVAMKMALQYWRNTGRPNKNRFICFADGYHGDTLGAMSVSDPERSLHKAFKRSVIPQFVVNIPTDEYGLAELETLVGGIQREAAAVIIESLVQGAGGMRFHSPDMLAAIRQMAARHDLLFIADEIATGFFRTGNRFACEEAGVVPDIMCVGKALTGGMVGLGATIASLRVFEAFLSDDQDFALMHGPTFMANPLACAAANASLDLFEREPRQLQVEAIERQLQEGLAGLAELPQVAEVRVKGAIGVVQLRPAYVSPLEMRGRCIELGCWIRPFHDIIYLTPPFIITAEELRQLTAAVRVAVSDQQQTAKQSQSLAD